MLSEQTVKELQKIIREEHFRDFSFEETQEIARGVICYFDLLAKMHHNLIAQGSSASPLNKTGWKSDRNHMQVPALTPAVNGAPHMVVITNVAHRALSDKNSLVKGYSD